MSKPSRYRNHQVRQDRREDWRGRRPTGIEVCNAAAAFLAESLTKRLHSQTLPKGRPWRDIVLYEDVPQPQGP